MSQLDEFWRSMLGLPEEEDGVSEQETIDSMIAKMDMEIRNASELSDENGFKPTEISNVYINPVKQMISIRIDPDHAICLNAILT